MGDEKVSIQPVQLIHLAIYALLIFFIYKSKNIKLKIFFAIIGIVFFIANPLRFKQEGMAKIERRFRASAELPAKIEVNILSFSEKQQKELETLKKQSKEIIKNEDN